MFGKIFHKEKKGGNLQLADYKSIWSKFFFLDELKFNIFVDKLVQQRLPIMSRTGNEKGPSF